MIIIGGSTSIFFICFLIGWNLYTLEDSYKIRALRFITKTFSVILTISIVEYVFWLIFSFSPLFSFETTFGNYGRLNCFGAFIMPSIIYLAPRFSGPFIEPGHLGMICVYLLYANGFRLKGSYLLWPILIAVILSLSLAGYVLLLIAVVLHLKISLKSIVTSIIIIFGLYIFVTEIWNGGDNVVSEKIISRLEYDESKGISGNNRAVKGTDSYFDYQLKSTGLIVGLGAVRYNTLLANGIVGGAGIKIFLLYYGFIGLILVACYYYLLTKGFPNKRYAYGFLILYAISMLQRAYPEWIAWVAPFVLSLNSTNNKQLNKQN